MSFADELKSLLGAGSAAKPAPVVAPKPKPVVAEPAPAAAVPSLPAPVVAPEPDPVLAAAANRSHEPTVVDYVPEPAPPAPKRTPLVDPQGKLCAYQLEDGTLIPVTHESIDDPLAKLSADDKRPIDEEEESQIAGHAPRSSGRIKFLWETYEKPEIDPSGIRLQKRLANDIARGLASRTRVEFDKERTANAAEIKRFTQR